MEYEKTKKEKLQEYFIQNHIGVGFTLMLLVAGGVFGYAFMRIVVLSEQVDILSSGLASTTIALRVTTDDLYNLRSETTDISQNLSSAKQEIMAASSDINAVKNQVGGVEQAVGSISGTVSTLEKLAATDPELLRKYSKVYFLSENYIPKALATIPQQYIYSNTKPESILSDVWPYLKGMLDSAKSAGVNIYVTSGYRSFEYQGTLKDKYVVVYGTGANAFSADQGYSEHQLGTTVDLITTGLGGELKEEFDQTAAFKWLENNAHKFGFTLSYPKGNSYYVYEPWHWRFVGTELATYLQNNNLNFYDVDQREISSYLVKLFE